MMPSFLYDAAAYHDWSSPIGVLLFDDSWPLVTGRHRRLVRRLMPGRKGRLAWRMLSRGGVIAWLSPDGDPRGRSSVTLLVDSGGILKVE
jgi:hypothetical protein